MRTPPGRGASRGPRQPSPRRRGGLTLVPWWRHVEIRENRGFSLVELERRQDRVHNRFIELGYTDLVSYYNLEDGSIDVEVVPLPSGPDRGVNASEMRSALPPDLLVDGLNITFRDSLPGQDESSVHGGGMLEPAGGSGLLCTGGFNVRKGSVRGVSTAWHCDPPFTYENRDGGHEYSATQRGSHIGEWGDLRWFSTAGSETDDFYWKWGHHRRDVSSVRHSVEGEELCRFGMKTGRKCGDHVYKKGVDKTVRGHSVNRLTAMHRENAEKGDSGGPWYWGTTAIGVHQGEKWIAPFTRDIFSEAGRLDEALGVTVLK